MELREEHCEFLMSGNSALSYLREKKKKKKGKLRIISLPSDTNGHGLKNREVN